MSPPVALSTASVFPETVRAGFALARELGYDGVELMVWSERLSQDVAAVGRLAEASGVPVLAVHAPCLAVTQRVWTADPVERLRRAVAAAGDLGARTVVVHPPFRWQRRYATVFDDEVRRAEEHSGVAVAVENMFPIVRHGVRAVPYSPGFDPTDVGYRHYTLDLSHTAVAGVDALALLDRMAGGLAHVHLADGSGAPRDEHLVPGRGTEPCAQVCELLATSGFEGTVVLEVNTRRARTRDDRVALLSEALLFARLHLRAPAAPAPPWAEASDAAPAAARATVRAMTRIAVLGAGKIGEALLAGLIAAGQPVDDLAFTERHPERARELTARHGVAAVDVPAAAQRSDVLVVAVKPQDIDPLLAELAAALRPGTLVVSLCAGLPTSLYESVLPAGTPVVRVMPNTPMLVGEAMSAVSGGTNATDDHLAAVEKMLGSVGRVVRLPESQQDAVTALSGSGPAYFFYLVEAMIDAGILLGLPRAVAAELIVQSAYGAAVMMRESGDHPVILREAVTSPAGTTIAAVRELERHGVRAALLAAIEAARDRSVELGKH